MRLLLLFLLLPACTPTPPSSSPPLGGREALGRIEVRQDVMSASLPENPLIQDQTRATKDDVKEVRSELLEANRDRETLRASLLEERMSAHKAHAERAAWIRTAGLIGFAAALPLLFFSTRIGLGLAALSVCLLLAVQLELIVAAYARWILGGIAVACAVYVVRERITLTIATAELVRTGRVMRNWLGTRWDLAKKDIIQSPTTRTLVDRYDPPPD
jgi:hypothetical protein